MLDSEIVMHLPAPKVSIIIRACNVARFLSAALQSVIEQDYTDWEALILNDNSDDDTEAAATPFLEKDRRFKYVKNITRLGRAGNLNLGLSLAQGKYISILDGDDCWCSTLTLTRTIAALEEKPEVVLVAVSVAEIDEHGSGILRYFPNTWREDRDIKQRLLIENCISQNAACFRRAHALALKGYNERLKYTEDYDLWLRLGLRGKIIKLPDVLAHYRIHHKSVGITHRRRQILEELRVITRYRASYPHLGLGIVHRLVNFIATFIPKALRRSIARTMQYHDIRTKILDTITSRA